MVDGLELERIEDIPAAVEPVASQSGCTDLPISCNPESASNSIPSHKPPAGSEIGIRPHEVIGKPDKLRLLPAAQLPSVSDALRAQLIDCVAKTGGHFASGLGAVELTVALHHVFNTPAEPLIWDVGHQCYPHKILTGRLPQMDGIRKLDGLSGFPVRSESPYDSFGVAHAGTSISAALGMASALQKQGSTERVVCVIGDGALTEGMAFEALNHAGSTKLNLLIVLNDNDMSISPNVGALSGDDSVKRNAGKRSTRSGKTPYQLFFQSLQCGYTGPVEGHNATLLSNRLRALKAKPGIQVLHVRTVKGKGYLPAEKDPVKFHAVGPFTPISNKKLSAVKSVAGTTSKSSKTKLTYTDVFSRWVCDAAASCDELDAITPAMREGSGLVEFEKRFPDRYFDVGIAEQHAVTFAAGLACQQRKPVVAIYSSFLQRAYDQVIHDVALQNLDVLFAIDRAGVVGADGATHHGHLDLSFLRCLPNMVVMAPANERECRQMLQTGLEYCGPASVRYERGSGPGVEPSKDLTTVTIGKAKITRRGERIALLCFGSVLEAATTAAKRLNATVVNMRFVKPLDANVLTRLAADHTTFVTLENNMIAGGAGSAVNEEINRQGLNVRVVNLGLPDEFMSHGRQSELLASANLDAEGIYQLVNKH